MRMQIAGTCRLLMAGLALIFILDPVSAAGTPQADQNPASVGRPAAIRGTNDQRVITPDMNNRERMETQRNIKKRAAAMRNQLIQAAEKERRQQAKTAGTTIPTLE